MDKDRIQSAIDHIKTAVDLDPWAVEIAVEALEHFREDTKNKQTNKQSDFADLVSRNLVLFEVKSGMIRTIDGEDWKRVSENVRGIRELPSAQPERTCVNCGRTANNGGWYADGRTRCPIEEHYALPKDGYCHLWEKRNVTDDDYPEGRADE